MPLFKVTSVCETFVVAEDSEQALCHVEQLFIDGDPDDDLSPVIKTTKVNPIDVSKKDEDKDVVITEEILEKSKLLDEYITVKDYFELKSALV